MSEAREPVQSFDDVIQRAAARQASVRLTGLRGSARAVVGAHLVRAHGDRPVLFLVADSKSADAFTDDLRTALGESESSGRTRVFPSHDTPPYDRFSPQPFVLAQRMDVLYRWLASASLSSAERMGDGPGEVVEGRCVACADPAPVVVAPWAAHVPRVRTR